MNCRSNSKCEGSLSDADQPCDAEDDDEDDEAVCIHDGASSVSGTALTGLAFEGIVNADKSSKDSTRHLEAIARIGAREH